MAGAGLWVKEKSGNISQVSDSEDVWDDTVLIEAYDRAVNSFKNSLKDKGKADNTQSKRQSQRGSKNHNKKKPKNFVNTKWKVGDKCQAIYFEDGLIYEGEIIGVQNEDKTCSIRFDYYENEEIVPIEDIFEISQTERNVNGNKRKSKEHKNHTARSNHPEYIEKGLQQRKDEDEMQDIINEDDCTNNTPFTSWTVGDMCLAPNPRTGTYEEAVLTFMGSESCILTFIRTNTKERLNITSLRPRKSNKKHCRHTCKHQSTDPGFGKYDTNWPHDFLDQELPPLNFIPQMPPIPPYFVPPSPHKQFSESYRKSHWHSPSVPPPPPPIGMPNDTEDESDNALASMLMSWYMVGFHTGYYQGIRSRSCAQDVSKQHDRTDPMDMYSDSSSKPDI